MSVHLSFSVFKNLPQFHQLHHKVSLTKSSPPQCTVGPKQLYALAHLRFTREAGTSQFKYLGGLLYRSCFRFKGLKEKGLKTLAIHLFTAPMIIIWFVWIQPAPIWALLSVPSIVISLILIYGWFIVNAFFITICDQKKNLVTDIVDKY